MQFGSSTVPLLPLAAVLGAGVLVLLVLWGAWRARRHPAPEPLPVSPPEDRTVQPCAADWTGEAAGGPADPPRPSRPRTVADVVAEQGADTGPLPVVPAAGGTTPPGPRPGRHAAEALSAPADERPDAATLARTRSVPAAGSGLAATAASLRRRPRPYPGPAAEPEPGTAPDDVPVAGRTRGAGPGDDAPGVDEPAGPRTASTEDPGPGWSPAGGVPWPVARLRIADEETGGPPGPATGPDGEREHGQHQTPAADRADEPTTSDPATGRPAPAEPAAADPGPPGGPAPDEDAATPLPPWSVERTVPAAQDLPTGDPAGPVADPPSTGASRSPEPVSRAVQQALAARAVQRARMRHTDADPDDPSTGGEQQELPLSVVPSRPSTPVAGNDARDRLLSVLIADPLRAVDATQRLDDARGSLEELGDVLRRRRADLAGAVRHLRDCGLDPVQIGRLSGMPVDDVRSILDGEDAR